MLESCDGELAMSPNLNTVLDAAMRLPIEERQELVTRLTISFAPRKESGLVRKHFGMIDSGDPNSANNERIDAELAASYLNDHSLEN